MRESYTVSGAGGLNLSVHEWGNPNGAPVLFIHGAGQSSYCWHKQVSSFLADKYRLITMDLRGHGASDKPLGAEYYTTNEFWAEDLHNVITELHLTNVIVVAWSHGGCVVGDYLNKYGDTALGGIQFVNAAMVLNESFDHAGTALLNNFEGYVSSDVKKRTASSVSMIKESSFATLSETDLDLLLDEMMKVPPEIRLSLSSRNLDYSKSLKGITAPVRVVVAENDQVIIPAMSDCIVDNILHAQKTVYTQCGHSPHFEQSERFNSELDLYIHFALSQCAKKCVHGISHQTKIETLISENISLTGQKQIFIDILNSSPIGIGISDFTSGKIHFANSKLEEIYRAPLVGASAKEGWVYGEQREEMLRRFEQQGSVVDFETLLKRSDGEEFWSLLTWKKIFFEGKKRLLFWIHEIDERKKAQEQLIASQNTLIENAHAAGKAEVATSVLHNVGNLLNTVIFSYESMNEIHEESILQKVITATGLLKEHSSDLTAFMATDPKGEKLLEYFIALADEGLNEREKMEHHLERMLEKITAIRDVIRSQQDYATATIESQILEPRDLVSATLKMIDGSLQQYSIKVIQTFESNKLFNAQKSKVQHIIVNLLKNAKEELMHNSLGDREITMSSYETENALNISIANNGQKIKKENLNKIFNHGFTTKEDGHGFGLHSCANYMAEMGGSLSVQNNEGRGVCFTMTFPKDM